MPEQELPVRVPGPLAAQLQAVLRLAGLAILELRLAIPAQARVP